MMEEIQSKSISHEHMGYDEPTGMEPILELDQYEKEIYVDKMTLNFSGYFDYAELQEMINDWCRRNRYHRMLQDHKEQLSKTGRNIALSYHLTRQFTHIHISTLNVEIEISDMTTEYKEIDGMKTRINKGDVEIFFNGFLMTHLRSRWETKANIAFIRGVIDKFIYKLNRAKYPGTVVADANKLAAEFRGFFNGWQARVGDQPLEKRVPSAISEDEKKSDDKPEEKKDDSGDDKEKPVEIKETKEESPIETIEKSQQESQAETKDKGSKPENLEEGHTKKG